MAEAFREHSQRDGERARNGAAFMPPLLRVAVRVEIAAEEPVALFARHRKAPRRNLLSGGAAPEVREQPLVRLRVRQREDRDGSLFDERPLARAGEDSREELRLSVRAADARVEVPAAAGMPVADPTADDVPRIREAGESRRKSGNGKRLELDRRRPKRLVRDRAVDRHPLREAVLALRVPAFLADKEGRSEPELVLRRAFDAVVPGALHDDGFRVAAALLADDAAPAQAVRQHDVADLDVLDRHLAARRRDEVPRREAGRRRPEEVDAAAGDEVGGDGLLDRHLLGVDVRVVRLHRVDGDAPVVDGEALVAQAEALERELEAGRGAAGAAEEVDGVDLARLHRGASVSRNRRTPE